MDLSFLWFAGAKCRLHQGRLRALLLQRLGDLLRLPRQILRQGLRGRGQIRHIQLRDCHSHGEKRRRRQADGRVVHRLPRRRPRALGLERRAKLPTHHQPDEAAPRRGETERRLRHPQSRRLVEPVCQLESPRLQSALLLTSPGPGQKKLPTSPVPFLRLTSRWSGRPWSGVWPGMMRCRD